MKRKFKNLTGKKFGRLTVIERHYPNDGGNRIRWLCECECGNKKVIYGHNLKAGDTKSCGCLQREIRGDSGVANMRRIICAYRQKAKKQGLDYDLTKEQFKEITQQNCYYCGTKPSNISKKYHSNGDYIYNGLDRVDNTKGYTIDNVVPCCLRCNIAKRNYTLKDFKEWIKNTIKHMMNNNLL